MIDKNEEIQEEFEKEENDIFSLEQIKKSLVFFNLDLDGGSMSIISNNNKNDNQL